MANAYRPPEFSVEITDRSLDGMTVRMTPHPRAAPRHLDPTQGVDLVQQAVDNYILMERKARAWDLWVETVGPSNPYLTWEGRPLREYLDTLLTLSAGPASPGRPSTP